MVLSVSATGILNCAALLFLPAILAVLGVAAWSSATGAAPLLLAGALVPVLGLALVLGRQAAATLGASLLKVDVEAPGAHVLERGPAGAAASPRNGSEDDLEAAAGAARMARKDR